MSDDKTSDQPTPAQPVLAVPSSEKTSNVSPASADHRHVLPQSLRHFPQIRLGTKIGNLLRRQQPKGEEQRNTVPKEGSHDQSGDGNGTTPTDQQLLPEKQEQQLNLSSQTSLTAEEAAEQKMDESPNDKLKENANGAKGHGDGGGNSAISAPEARQKWGRRQTSVVHPMESDQQQMPSAKQRPAASTRPPTLRLGPSSPTPWVYLQMADRSFRRTTVAQLRKEQRQNGRQTMEVPSANGADKLLAPEFVPLTSALTVQNVFHRFALIAQGFTAGLTFGHTFFAFAIADLQFLQHNAWMAAPTNAVFHFCLAIGIVEALDRFEFGTPFHSLCSLPSVGIVASFFAFLASISLAQIEQLLAQQILKDNSVQWDAQLLFTGWQLLSAVRAVCAMFGWLTMAIRPTANATREKLVKMLPSNSPTS